MERYEVRQTMRDVQGYKHTIKVADAKDLETVQRFVEQVSQARCELSIWRITEEEVVG